MITMPSDQLLPPDCRRDASPRPTQLSMVQHRARAEPWTVQHLCTRDSTPRHAFGMFPKPGVAGSIPAGAPVLACTGQSREDVPCLSSAKSAVGADECRHAQLRIRPDSARIAIFAELC